MPATSKKGKIIVPTKTVPEIRYFNKKGKEIILKVSPNEPKILPLVEALNDTKLVKTFSSCQGHFNGTDQLRYMDRNFADVRFRLLPNSSIKKLEILLGEITDQFWRLESPVHMDSYKKIIGTDKSIYLITLTPKDRYDHPSKKRKDTNAAINIVAKMVKDWTLQNRHD